MIDRIDKDTDDSKLNIEKGKKSLMETYKDVSSTRGVIIKVFFKN
jgi:syntaxin 5